MQLSVSYVRPITPGCHMRRIILICTVVMLSTVGLLACRSGGSLEAAIDRTARLSDTSGIDTTEATVRIENNKFQDLVVYVITSGGMKQRIGMANGNTTTVLKIPDYVLVGSGELRFSLRPIGGGREETSDRIWVAGGDEVVLTLLP